LEEALPVVRVGSTPITQVLGTSAVEDLHGSSLFIQKVPVYMALYGGTAKAALKFEGIGGGGKSRGLGICDSGKDLHVPEVVRGLGSAPQFLGRAWQAHIEALAH
jgi:hypothetical protein